MAHPRDAALACEAARFCLDRGMGSEAERQLERAVLWHPEYRPARELRGSLYLGLGRQEEAEQEFAVASALTQP